MSFGPRFNPDQFVLFNYSCGRTLAAGQTCRVLVGFYPHSEGPKQVELVAKSDNPADGQAVATVSGTGVLGRGDLYVTKVVAGDPSIPTPRTTFTVAVDCHGTALDTTLTFGATGRTKPVRNIPEDTECTVTETGTGDATGVDYDPGGCCPPTVKIVANSTVTVTVTNVFIGV